MSPISTTEQLLTRLVETVSVNPLLPGAAGQADETALAAEVLARLRAAGVDAQLQPVCDGRSNVVAHIPRAGSCDAEVILLSAHMDTYPANGPLSGYQAICREGVMHGRGSADAKGPLAAMLSSFLDAAGTPDHREAYLVATIDEECLLMGAKALIGHGMRPTLGITGEPTNLIPIVAQKGIVRGSVTVRGSRSHAAYPQRRTAVNDAARVVAAVADLNDQWPAHMSHASLGHPTVSVTRIDSDGGMNLAARSVHVHYDARFLPGTEEVAFMGEIFQRLQNVVGHDVDLTMNDPTFVSPPNECPDTPIASEFFGVVERVMGTCVPETFSYGGEAGVLATFCDAALVFGPGDAKYSHGDIELIELAAVDHATSILHELLVGGAQRPDPGEVNR